MVLSQKQLADSVRRRRSLEILAGLIIGIVGGAFLLLGLVCACLILALPGKNPPVLPTALTIAIGAPCPFLAWRLIWGRTRKEDGGFFSPTELRAAGICLILSPLAAIGRIWFFESIVFAYSYAVACFILASRRASIRRDTLAGTSTNTDESHSPKTPRTAAEQPENRSTESAERN